MTFEYECDDADCGCHEELGEVGKLRAALLERDAEIKRLRSHLHTCGPTCTKAGCINARQRKVLEQALEALNGSAGREDVWGAIGAIQGVLK